MLFRSRQAVVCCHFNTAYCCLTAPSANVKFLSPIPCHFACKYLWLGNTVRHLQLQLQLHFKIMSNWYKMETFKINFDLRGIMMLAKQTEQCISLREMRLFSCLSGFRVSAIVQCSSMDSVEPQQRCGLS